jgi:polyribonucleotide nucleotidyltransferase
MLGEKQFNIEIDGKSIQIATGGFASQAGGAVTVRQGDTVLIAAATMGRTAREGIDFFPLTVDYEERMYAGGKIPGSFFRREGRPSERAILIARLTDRPIRPLFPKDMRNDVQVILYSISADEETPIDVLAILGASAALSISDVPFAGPVAALRVTLDEAGGFHYNSTYDTTEASALDLRIGATRDAILMVEAGSSEVDESVMVDAIRSAHETMQPLFDVQDQMRQQLGKEKRIYPSYGLDEKVLDAVRTNMGNRLEELLSQPRGRDELYSAEHEIQDDLIETMVNGETEIGEMDVKNAFGQLFKQAVRERILKDDFRPDGRAADDLRALDAKVDLSPRAHGSGLFSRGGTQVLTLATLGTPRERQELDTLSPVEEKRYMHHYNFPPFSTGETRFLRGSSRREIGHGALAERALIPVLPPQDEFPYTMRLVSEVLSSNGSTSMASVCGSTLALMDTGVPISAPVAGIAMGLIKGENDYVVLTDIQGVEDHLGDMDFKVAGTRNGINALQMDIKTKGITPDIMAEALKQARGARLKILDTIESAIAKPNPELKPHAPRMIVMKVNPDKIGAIIGPGGKTIRSIQDNTNTRVDIEDDGTVFVASPDGPGAQKAREMIERLTEEAQLGRIYTGRVARTTNYGAFVEILPGVDGMVHISQLDSEHVPSVEHVAKVGDEITVMVTNIDADGKIRLSRQAVLEGWTAEEARERDNVGKSSGGGRRGGGRGGGRRSG